MASKFLKHKWQKVVFASFLIFITLLLFVAFLVNQYWSPILADKAKSTVLSSSDSLYNINFSDAKLNVLQGKITLYNITLKVDSAIYHKRKRQHLAPNNLIDLHVKKLVLSNIHPFKLYFQHVLNIGRITLSAPQVHISYELNHTKDTVDKDHRTAWQKVSKTLKSIHVGDIFLNDVNFTYNDYSGNKVEISRLKEMNLHASDLLIDSLTQTDKSRLLYCKDIIAELNNYEGKTPNGLYTYTVSKLKLSTLKSQLIIEGLTLDPVRATVFFDKSRKDKYSLHLDSLQLNNFDFLNYHKYRALTASSLLLTNGTLNLFNNPNKLKTVKNKIESFPNIAIHQLNINLKIDTVIVKRINVLYSELNKKSKKIGTIAFNNTSGQFLNVTNNPIALQKNNISTVRLTSYFMNRGRLNIFFTFNLTDKNAAYSYKGSLGPMKLQFVNPVSMPLGMIKIKSGTLKEFTFDVNGDSKISKGKITVLYNDLKISLLQADTAKQKLKRKFIASLFANLFILKHDNPDKEGEAPRSYNVTYARPINSPFFKTAWQTLLAGLKPSAGYDTKTQQATSAKMAQSAINKQRHKAKKELRKQKRAQRKLNRQLNKQREENLKVQ